MTSQKSFFNLSIMKETLLRLKYLMILNTVVLFISSTLPAFLTLDEIQRNLITDIEAYEYTSLRYLLGANPYLVLCACAFALIVVIYTFSYLFRFNSVQFYNSLPHKRECVAISKLAACVIAILIPIAIIFAVNSLCYTAYHLADAFSYSVLVSGIAEVILAVLTVLTTVYFAVSLSGNFFAALIVTGFIYLVYPVTTLAISATWDLWVDGVYLTMYYDLARFFCPVIIFAREAEMTAFDVIYSVIYSVAMASAGVLCYRARRSEDTSKFFAFPRIGSFLKYYVSAVGSLCFGAIVMSISHSSSLITFISYILGLFIIYSAMQAIFEKNMRMMFKNGRRFLIFAAIWAVCLIGGMSGALNNVALKAMPLSEIAVTTPHGRYIISDRENIDAVLEFYNSEYTEGNSYYLQIESNPSNPIFTLTFCRDVTYEACEKFQEQLYNSDEYRSLVESMLKSDPEDCGIEIEFSDYSAIDSRELWDEVGAMLLSEIGSCDYDEAKKSGIYGAFMCYESSDEINIRYVPIYNCYRNTVALLRETEYDDEDFYELELQTSDDDTTIFKTDDPAIARKIVRSAGGTCESGDKYVNVILTLKGETREVNVSYDSLSDEVKKLINPENKDFYDLGIETLSVEDSEP